ncbi:MAG: hypothetical protein AAGA77_06730 [Bacteroidota bacterium]
MKNNTDLDDEKLEEFTNAAVQYNVEKQLREKYSTILEKRKTHTSSKSHIIKLKTLLNVAAIVVSVLGSIFLIQYALSPVNPKSMAERYLEQTKVLGNPDITRKGATTAVELQINANEAFVKEQYSLAAQYYEKYRSDNAFSALDQFYLGVSYLKTGELEKAISLFIEINSNDNEQIEEVDWFLSLTYILSNQNESAKPILEKIITKNSYKVEKAKDLLNALQKS